MSIIIKSSEEHNLQTDSTTSIQIDIDLELSGHSNFSILILVKSDSVMFLTFANLNYLSSFLTLHESKLFAGARAAFSKHSCRPNFDPGNRILYILTPKIRVE